MELNFSKYQGAGNDFVLIDDRSEEFDVNDYQLIKKLCDRRFGIGADGLMLLRNSGIQDFKMVYFNADGHEGSMCGNGGRCIVSFAKDLGLIDGSTVFDAVDGRHDAEITELEEGYWVALGMNDVLSIESIGEDGYLNTGSPHYVAIRNQLGQCDVVKEGRGVRYNDRFSAQGTNVNFIELLGENHLAIRTYERGVEDETLACGTGVTAAAIYANSNGLVHGNVVEVDALGGKLKVSFEVNDGKYSSVQLEGPAKFVFNGVIRV